MTAKQNQAKEATRKGAKGMTNAQRQKKYRERRKASGLVTVKVTLTQEANDFLRQCFDASYDPGDTFGQFLERAMVRGAVFTANTGRGKGRKLRLPEGALRKNA